MTKQKNSPPDPAQKKRIDLGKRLRRLRLKFPTRKRRELFPESKMKGPGLSMRQVAQIIGFSHQTYSEYENGDHWIKPPTLEKLSELFGVELSY